MEKYRVDLDENIEELKDLDITDEKLLLELIDYWKSGYRRLYDRYSFELRNNKALEEKNSSLYDRIQQLDNKIGLCVADIMERDNEIITLKRIIDEAHMNATLGNNFIDRYGEP